MRLESTGKIQQPLETVFELVRDRLPDVVPYMPNVDRIVVDSREEADGKVRIVNTWFAKADIPQAAKKILKPEILSWTDRAEWDNAAHHVDYVLESKLGREIYDARGRNSFRATDDGGTELTVSCEITIHADKVPGVPKFLAKKFMPAVEALIKKIMEPNLMSLADGLNRYFAEKS